MVRIARLAASVAGLSHQVGAVPRALLQPQDPSPPGNVDNSNLPPLKFTKDGSFHISIFSDLHTGQYQNKARGVLQDLATQQVVAGVLDDEKPDFVVLNGDLINGDTTKRKNATQYVDIVVNPLVQRKLTWASTYGNHDHDYAINGDGIMEREHMWPGARTKSMVSGDVGTSNYYLPVYSDDCSDADNEKCSPEMIMWFFDSRGGRYYQKKDSRGKIPTQPNWVHQDVVDWFNKTNADLVKKHNKVIPSLAFVHIPINATRALQSSVNAQHNPGINEETPVAPQSKEYCSDGKSDASCYYGGQDEPFMRALAGTRGIVGLFYGHDHGDSWCTRWDEKVPGTDIVPEEGMALCYGQHSGYGGYGDWSRGARQIIVNRDQLKKSAVDTHIRLETGEIVGAVSLNSTFGKDSYPKTPVTETYLKNFKSIKAFSSQLDSKSAGQLPNMIKDLMQGVPSVGGVWATCGYLFVVGCVFGMI